MKMDDMENFMTPAGSEAAMAVREYLLKKILSVNIMAEAAMEEATRGKQSAKTSLYPWGQDQRVLGSSDFISSLNLENELENIQEKKSLS
jgi:hypothetical protein